MCLARLDGRGTREHPTIFYGWVIVAVMALVGALSMAMASVNYGLFIKPMGDELNIQRSVFGWVQTVRQLACATTSPVLGSLVDRFGSRILLPVATLVAALALVGLGSISAGWQLVALFAVIGSVGIMAGPGDLMTTVPISNWFVHKRAKALSLAALGRLAGALVFVPLTQLLIATYGWRTAWVILAGLGAAIVIPCALLFLRRRPEDLGLQPDGNAPPVDDQSNVYPTLVERSWTRQEAVATSTLWRLVFVFSISMFVFGSFAIHRIPNFMDRGLDPGLVSVAIAVDASSAGVSTFMLGNLARRVQPRFLGFAALMTMGIGIVVTMQADTTALMFVATATWGLGAGGILLIQNYLWPAYFGREHLGSITGMAMPIMLVLGGIGAPFAGYIRDFTGSYNPVWLGCVGLLVLGAVVLSTTRAPERRPLSAVGEPTAVKP